MTSVVMMMRRWARVHSLALFALMFLATTGKASAAARESLTLQTPTGSVLVECFADKADFAYPTVLVLSGSKGFWSPAYEEIGRALRSEGLRACLVHFLSPKDVSAIGRAGSSDARERYYAKHQSGWIATIRSVATYYHAQSGHAGKVGLLGISLGAEMALAVSANSTDIDALVIVDGGFPEGYTDPVHALPPLRLIWGDGDKTFPLAVGAGLKRMARRLGDEADFDIYKGGHAFFLDAATPQACAAHLNAARFFASRL
ncbi:dienelactone hydrolase family protein [Rhodanobacter sp. 7MK24]|uniref:dienelactone hydrolase family protein n=1 Tax=Rhodanobacter sp. 7MK24 TaxID=2775922 RepID=UPI001CE22C2E|nr:dienelactone hydrolase family protein [Rhodanobacter sp. 7MK24]